MGHLDAWSIAVSSNEMGTCKINNKIKKVFLFYEWREIYEHLSEFLKLSKQHNI